MKNNDIKENKRYPESEDILYDNDFLEEKCKNKNLLLKISNEIKQKIAEELTNEILDELLKTEIKNKTNVLSHKKDIKKNSNSSIVSRESISGLTPSPSRKNNRINSSQNMLNNNESYPTMNSNNNIQDEEALNDSIFKRTVYEIKKNKELNYYDKYILPRLLNLIESNIKQNYITIIDNLKKPLKKDDVEVMEDIANLIAYDTIYNNSIIKYNSRFSNKEIIKKEYIDQKILNDFNKKLEKESRCYTKYYYEYLNQCVYDTANEIIRNK